MFGLRLCSSFPGPAIGRQPTAEASADANVAFFELQSAQPLEMLHEILLSLSGHPSPLLSTAGATAPNADLAREVVSPPERALLASVSHISDLHVKLLSFTAQISTSHPSTTCRAVATAVDAIHLAAFQQKVLEVEETILRKDSKLVGAYNIVPITAVVSEFTPWARRLEWLWGLVQFMLKEEQSAPCTGARLMDRLRSELQTGYADVEETARSLVRAAEVTWLKQVSAWILYGRLPSFGGDDFFIQKSTEGEEVCFFVLKPRIFFASAYSDVSTRNTYGLKNCYQLL